MNLFKAKCTEKYQKVRNGIRYKLHHISITVINKDEDDEASNVDPEIVCDTDQLSWTVGETILAQQTECIIHKILYTVSSQQPRFQDIITVKFANGMIKKYNNRYELKSHPMYIRNRKKLKRYCTVEIYSCTLNQWIHSYIDNVTATNNKWFSVNGTAYNLWSNQIRCCPTFLNLTQTSNICVFDADIMQWCYGKIMNVEQQFALNIFEVHYTKYNKIYVKYLHEFSANIALANHIMYTDICSVFDENISITSKDLDITDVKYYRLVLQGYMSIGFIHCDISLIIIKYIEFSYALVMAIEAKTYSLAIKNRDNKLMPKQLPRSEISLVPPLHPLELQIRDILIQKDEYTCENFRAAMKLVQIRKKKEMNDNELHDHRLYNINHGLQISTHGIRDESDLENSDANFSLSFQSGIGLSPLPSDFES